MNDDFLNGYEDKIYENKGEHPYSYTVKKVIFKNGKVVSNSGKTDESITKEDIFNESQNSTEKNKEDKLPQTGEETNPFANYLAIVVILGIIWLGSMMLIDRENKKMTKK
ncbi:unknown [Clostridium sp. CAG:780]|nr:unknown [Clostridium sp. CAG:780]